MAVCSSIEAPDGVGQAATDRRVFAELWISFASLLRSYLAAHGLGADRQATIEANHEKIIIRHKAKQLCLDRDGAIVRWARENGSGGTMQISRAGRLWNGEREEEMDMAAENWARELMQ
ncbi:MAG: hypothetical protein ACP5E2_03805 [Terracidiphilus sp.]